jgi:hypothetical protein
MGHNNPDRAIFNMQGTSYAAHENKGKEEFPGWRNGVHLESVKALERVPRLALLALICSVFVSGVFLDFMTFSQISTTKSSFIVLSDCLVLIPKSL